jgi:signal transduction histidine kinase
VFRWITRLIRSLVPRSISYEFKDDRLAACHLIGDAMKTTKKSQQSRSLITTLAIAFLTLSVVAILISSALQLLSTIQTQQQAIADRQYLLAQNAAETVSNFIQEKFSVLDAAATLDVPTAATPEALKQALQSLLGLQPAFARLLVLDTNNQEVSYAARISQESSWPFIEQIKGDILSQARTGQHYISSVYIDEITNEPMVVIAVPVTSSLGDFQGTLIAEVKLKFMWTVVDQLHVGETGWAYVVDRQGALIAYRDSSRVLKGENVSQLQAVSDFINAPLTVGKTSMRIYQGLIGTTVVGTYVPLETPDWAVVTELPWQEAYRGVLQASETSIAVMLGIALIAGFVGVVVARRLSVPLVSLTETATRIADGERALQAEEDPASAPREVVSLATAFNRMSRSLQLMIAQENANRVVLETTVDVYLAFVEQVAQGDLKQRMDLGAAYNLQEEKAEPLYVLGANLNKMVNSLAEMTDSNARLLAETQRAKEEAEEANRIKSQFLASMSHELRTPLNAILSFSKYMRQGIFGPVSEQQVDYLGKTIDSGEHLLALINDVLDITKIQSNMLNLFVEDDIDIAREIEKLAASAEKMLEERPVKLVMEVDSNLPLMTCDKRRVRQIFYNLISNAIKFTEEGTITISAKHQNGELLFTVSDTGPGIAPKDQVRIFQPFIQTETGIKHAGGTGLGLPISRQLAIAHGGRLEVESEPGKGARFVLTLPIKTDVQVVKGEQAKVLS